MGVEADQGQVRRPIDYHFCSCWFSPGFKHAPFHPREVLKLPPEDAASGASVQELKNKHKELLEFVSNGRKKKRYFALQEAFKPIHVMMDWPNLAGEPAGGTFRRTVYVVSGTHTTVDIRLPFSEFP